MGTPPSSDLLSPTTNHDLPQVPVIALLQASRNKKQRRSQEVRPSNRAIRAPKNRTQTWNPFVENIAEIYASVPRGVSHSL